MKRIMLLIGIVLSLLLVFCSCDDTGEQSSSEIKVTITVEYVASEGGYIEGQASQTSETLIGASVQTSTVTARASEGYRFVGWSDVRQRLQEMTLFHRERFSPQNLRKTNNIPLPT